MKEIGGYFELDMFNRPMLHESAIALNCGRNALAYLIVSKEIKRIALPYFICNSVIEVCQKYGTDIRYYHIGMDFCPINIEVDSDEWLYLVNYYGQVSDETITTLDQRFKHVIVDNSQNYFAKPLEGLDTLYTCRKYFGVADGAFLYTDAKLNSNLPMDESFERMRFVLGRYERPASEFYSDAAANNAFFKDEPIKQMSRLTRNLLHAIDYEYVKQKRTSNFSILLNELNSSNELSVKAVSGAFMYPYMTEESDTIKKRLLEKKIYIPTLWPNVVNELPQEWNEWRLAKNILPIPCDQRYSEEDMQIIVQEVQKCID